MSNPTPVVWAEIGDYQAMCLHTAITALADIGYHPCLVEGARIRYGATHDEVAAVLDRLGVPRGT